MRERLGVGLGNVEPVNRGTYEKAEVVLINKVKVGAFKRRRQFRVPGRHA